MDIVLFYLKKVISFFIMPYGFAVTLLLVSIYLLVKKRDKLALLSLSLATVTLLIFSYKYFSNMLLYPVERETFPYTKQKVDDIKYIHILGSGYSDDIKVPISSRLSESGLKRIIEGVIEYKEHNGSKLIVTGYKYPYAKTTYTQTAVELLTKLGIPKSDIISSEQTKDTDDEALFAKKIVKDNRYILITSASHMKRAYWIMKQHGLHPIPVKTDYHSGDLNSILFFPSPNSLKESHTAMHEYIGMLWQKLKSFIY